jgi:osmotically-inducible protein OsmY
MPTSTSVTTSIASALHRDATIDSDNLTVVCDGPDVWLSGHVQSWAARSHAESAALATPGVRFVHNNVRIDVPRLDTLP